MMKSKLENTTSILIWYYMFPENPQSIGDDRIEPKYTKSACSEKFEHKNNVLNWKEMTKI